MADRQRRLFGGLLVVALVMAVACSAGTGALCEGRGVEDWFGSTGTFDTARAALGSVDDAPGTPPLAEYQRVKTDADTVDFVYRVDREEHHRWEIVRHEGKWIVYARSGCIPAFPEGEE